jgi:hypothetical protein
VAGITGWRLALTGDESGPLRLVISSDFYAVRAGDANPAGMTIGSSSTHAGGSNNCRAGTFRWTTPSGRQYTTEPTRYPV